MDREKEFEKKFWQRFEFWREQNHITASSIEQRLGWFSGKVRQYRGLGRVFSAYDLSLLCSEFDIGIDYLLYGEQTKKITDKSTLEFLVKYRNCDKSIQELIAKIVDTHLTN